MTQKSPKTLNQVKIKLNSLKLIVYSQTHSNTVGFSFTANGQSVSR